MIINNYNISWTSIFPRKTDTVLLIYSNAEIPCPISFKGLQPIARRYPEIIQIS